MRDDAAEEFRILHSRLEGSVAPHRQATDDPALPCCDRVEIAVDKTDNIIDDVRFISGSFDSIAVSTAPTVRHNQDQREVTDVSFDARAAAPDCMIVR